MQKVDSIEFVSDDTATHCNTLQLTATHCNSLQLTATHCTSLHLAATHCNSLHLTATHCTSLQQMMQEAEQADGIEFVGEDVSDVDLEDHEGTRSYMSVC